MYYKLEIERMEAKAYMSETNECAEEECNIEESDDVKNEAADAEVDNVSEDGTDSASDETTKPSCKYHVFQKVLAKDNETPLLYEAVVRKIVWGPKSSKVNLSLMAQVEETSDVCMVEHESFTWHYFVHFVGWNVKWDRWVDEEKLFEDTDDARILAKRLKEESKVLKKNKSRKKFLEVMQRIVRLERELRQKQARGESIEEVQVEKCNEKEVKPIQRKIQDSDGKEINGISKAFLTREVKLRKLDLRSRKCSINLPFPLKKILTDDWEVITQCEMLHSMPASISVKDALDAYLDRKLKMLAGVRTDDIKEEKKLDDDGTSDLSTTSHTDNDDNHDSTAKNYQNVDDGQEWRDMVDGIALFFDEALTKSLLYRHEIPQCLWLEQNHEKRYCELYPCEYLIRLCLKLPDTVADADYAEDQKAKILFKIGDLLRFLQKHQDLYLLQRYRKATTEEKAKANKLKRKLGLAEMGEEIKDTEKLTEGPDDKTEKRNASDTGGQVDHATKRTKGVEKISRGTNSDLNLKKTRVCGAKKRKRK